MSHLELIVLLPIAGAVAIALGAHARYAALGTAAAVLIAVLIAALRFDTTIEGVFQLESSRPLLDLAGFPALNLAFGIDGISLVLLLLSAVVMLAAIFYAPREYERMGHSRLYYLSLLLIGGGAIGAFCATDLFFLYAFHELALIPTFLMIGIFGKGKDRVKVAWTVTIYLGIGSLVLLVGLVMAVVGLGGASFDLTTLAALAKNPETAMSPELQSWTFLLLLVGFGILVSLFPFHTWAPAAYAQAPIPVAMLHAGLLKKFGLYGLIRVALPLAPAGAEAWLNLLLILLLGNVLFVGFATIAQRSFDRLLGYASVMHMGFVFLGIAAGNVLGLSGAVLLMFAHGISIAALFALAGVLHDRFGTYEIEKLRGMGARVPGLALLFGIAAFTSMGLTVSANFAAEVTIFFSAFADAGGELGPLQWATIAALWGVVISAVYMLRAFRTIFYGPDQGGPEIASSVLQFRWRERVPLVVLISILIAVGFVPEILNRYIRPAVEGLLLVTAG